MRRRRRCSTLNSATVKSILDRSISNSISQKKQPLPPLCQRSFTKPFHSFKSKKPWIDRLILFPSLPFSFHALPIWWRFYLICFHICFGFQFFLQRSFMDLLVFACRAILAYHFASVFLWCTIFCFLFFKIVWWSYSYHGMTGRKSMASGTSIWLLVQQYVEVSKSVVQSWSIVLRKFIF